MSYETRADLGLAWGVKASFRQYLESTGDAQWRFGYGAATTQHDELYFLLVSVDGEWDADGAPTSGTLHFGGTVSVSAHFGMLDIVIDAPRIAFGPEGAALSTQGRTLAKLIVDAPVIDGGVLMWHEAPSTLALDAGAVEVDSPVIVQTSVKTVSSIGAPVLAAMWRSMTAGIEVPVALHLDHCPDRDVVTECLQNGWNSVLFDASELPVEENLRQTIQVVGGGPLRRPCRGRDRGENRS
ncbi:fructose-bisphosphate aldolase class-II-domain-containing protein [Podospora conica]|nr:fructose-bisphosphate aldolase class-II-domain-containing protein [Schizothecium conicum]